MQDQSITSPIEVKRCCRCHEVKPITEFFRNNPPTANSPFRPHCKKCHRKDQPPEKHDNWRNRTRAIRLRTGKAPKIGALRIGLGEPTSCYLCGDPINWETGAIDHVIPVSRGGASTVENLRWAHRTCNYIHGSLLIEELRPLLERILKHLP